MAAPRDGSMWDVSLSTRTLSTRMMLEPSGGDSASAYARALSRTRVDDPNLLLKPYSPPERVLQTQRPATISPELAPYAAAHEASTRRSGTLRTTGALSDDRALTHPPRSTRGQGGECTTIRGSGPFGSLTRSQLPTSMLFRPSDSLGVHATHLRYLTPVERRREDASKIRPVYTATSAEETRAAALKYLNGHGVGIRCATSSVPVWAQYPYRAARAAPGL